MNPYLIIATLVSLIIWTALAQLVLGDSRQTCETVQSAETCAWELR
jgi:hypothetical protein